jgi:4-carboxymuconolactone decarboxylase
MATKKTVKRPEPRLINPNEHKLNKAQKVLRDAIASGPRKEFRMVGPFAIFMHAPEYGIRAQELGGYVRLKTSVSPRLSELAILCTAKKWKAQFEWFAHAPIAEKVGVKASTIKSIKAGRRPVNAPTDERAIYDFVEELYTKRRVSDVTYRKVNKFLGDRGAVELVGILGYYSMIAMQLNVFRAPLPDGVAMPFSEG